MRRLLLSFILLIAAVAVQAAAPKWEEVSNPPAEVTVETTDTESVAIHSIVKDSYVYIATTEPVTVKVFTILGQLISSEKVGAGIHRLKINARGIYILKLGSITRRITV